MRQFGSSGPMLSEICAGSMFFVPRPGQDRQRQEQEAGKALLRALERGVNTIHCSKEYGAFDLLSQVLKGHPKRHDLHYVLKVRQAWDFRGRIEQALSALHTDCIDIVQWVQTGAPEDQRIAALPHVFDDVVATHETLKKEGKVKLLATFPYFPKCARAALDTGKFEGFIVYLNPSEMDLYPFFDEFKGMGMGIVSIRPFYGGLFTEKRRPGKALAADDRWEEEPKFKERRCFWARVLEHLAPEIVGADITRFALRLALSHPAITTVVCGMNTVAQVDSVCDMAEDAELDPSLLDRVMAARKAANHEKDPPILY